MSGDASRSGPKLSGLKFLVEKILHSDATDTIMKIGDQNALGTAYALKIIKKIAAEEEPEADNSAKAKELRATGQAPARVKPEDLQAAFDLAMTKAKATFEASQKLGHPTTLKYHDFRAKKSWFRVSRGELLMEFVNGSTLDQISRPAIGPAIAIARQVAAGLAHMHRRGVIHGNLSPVQVMLSKSGQVKILGYGRPKETAAQLGRAARQFASPEQIKSGTLDEKADIYSFGSTFYKFLTGKAPKRGDSEATKMSLPTALNPAIPTPVSNVLVACLQSNSGKRPESMFDVSEQLDKIVKQMGLEEQSLRGIAGGAEA